MKTTTFQKNCPHCSPFPKGSATKIRKIGAFHRKEDRKKVSRYVCNLCNRSFSSATFTFEYRQRKRCINLPLFELLASNVSMRRSAKILKINRKTVDRRLPYFDLVANNRHKELLATRPPSEAVQFDDMETSEHTKLKPLSIPLVVDHPSRIVLGYDVAQMPAKGHLAKISVNKYGPRKDLRHIGWRNVLVSASTTVKSCAIIRSDSHKRYPEMIARYLPQVKHEQVKSRRACVAGQGELKKGGFDPIFSLNHTAAMFRANINRLIRKTWCTTKRSDRLRCHLSLYVLWHNEMILAKEAGRKPNWPFNCA